MSRWISRGLTGAITAAAALCPAAPASADASNITYSYDALGRLTAACDATPALGNLSTYHYDAAGNRSLYAHSRTDQALPVDGPIYSPNGQYMFIMQGDGNLVLYFHSGSGWVPMNWATNTVGTGANFATFQSDGNLVVYAPSGPVWSSNTWQNHCATLSVQNDGNVVIRNVQGDMVWSTNTGGH